MSAAWSFHDFGAEFDEHVAAHLPGYADVQRLVALVASHVVPAEGIVADLGASTGASALTIEQEIGHRSLRFELYDDDASMLDVARRRCDGLDVRTHRLDLTRSDLRHSGASLTLALWLLQFLPPTERLGVLARARIASSEHGAILVAAKTTHVDPRWDRIAVDALDDYKAEQGVDPTTRVEKTRSLRGVLQQESTAQLALELVQSGWRSPTVLWRWHVWAVVGAFASELEGGEPDE